MQRMIRIWKYSDAPQHLKDLHPGTESTWVMEAPAGMSGEVEMLIEEYPLPSGQVDRYALPDGAIAFFGQSLDARECAAEGNLLAQPITNSPGRKVD